MLSFLLVYCLIFVLLTGACIGLYFGALYLVDFLAKKNLFFTKVQEGHVKAIKKFGKFQRLIIAYEHHSFDQHWDVRHVSEGKNEKTVDNWWDEEEREYSKKKIELRPEPRRWGGIFWVGIPPLYTVHRYTFRFSSFRQDTNKEGKLQEIILSRVLEDIDYILAQDDTYFTEVQEAESKGMVPLTVQLLITARVVNPYKALFRAEEWLEQTINIIKPSVRHYVSQKHYEDLIGKPEGLERDFDDLLKRQREGAVSDGEPPQEGLAAYIERSYGIRIKKLGIVSFKPPDRYQEIASKRWEGEKEAARLAAVAVGDAERIKILAGADAARIEVLAEAEVKRIDKVYPRILEKGAEAVGVRALESIDKAGEKQGNWIVPFGAKILERILGGKEEK